MASKKVDDGMPDDVKKAKEQIGNDAKAVGKAAERLLRIPMDSDGFIGRKWGETEEAVDALDNQFSQEAKLEALRQKFERGDVEVRVLQQGPGGRLTDVTDKVNPRDLRPEDVGGITTDDGREVPFSKNVKNREAAVRLLQELLPGLRLGGGEMVNAAGYDRRSTVPDSIRKMEKALADSDKTLEHWKR